MWFGSLNVLLKINFTTVGLTRFSKVDIHFPSLKICQGQGHDYRYIIVKVCSVQIYTNQLNWKQYKCENEYGSCVGVLSSGKD